MSAFTSKDGNVHFVVPAENLPATPEASPVINTPIAPPSTRPTTSDRGRSLGDAENVAPSMPASTGPQRRRPRAVRRKTTKKTKRPGEPMYRRVLGHLDRQVTTQNREFTLDDIYFGITTPSDE